jgi:nicotinamidase-related amidase
VDASDVLLVIDMQVGLFADGTKFDAEGLVARINRLSQRIRKAGGRTIFVRHTQEGHPFEAGSAAWQFLPAMDVRPQDEIIAKATCDCFAGTPLADLVPAEAVGRLIVTGCATEFCVDTTVRSAAIRGYRVCAPEDGHTTSDRPHLSAEAVIRHHNYIWSDFIGARGPIRATQMSDL